MRRRFDSFDLPPAIAAAHRRTPRHLRRRAKNPENNYIAESATSRGKRSRIRHGAGAPKGNGNAFRPGAAKLRAMRAYVRFMRRKAQLLIALRAWAIARAKRERLAP